nr:MAG TPA: hypothetical protein [Caudoviricetes sp.]
MFRVCWSVGLLVTFPAKISFQNRETLSYFFFQIKGVRGKNR